eukprot:UN01679
MSRRRSASRSVSVVRAAVGGSDEEESMPLIPVASAKTILQQASSRRSAKSRTAPRPGYTPNYQPEYANVPTYRSPLQQQYVPSPASNSLSQQQQQLTSSELLSTEQQQQQQQQPDNIVASTIVKQSTVQQTNTPSVAPYYDYIFNGFPSQPQHFTSSQQTTQQQQKKDKQDGFSIFNFIFFTLISYPII